MSSLEVKYFVHSQAFSTCLDTWCSGVDQGMARVMGGVGLVLAV